MDARVKRAQLGEKIIDRRTEKESTIEVCVHVCDKQLRRAGTLHEIV